MARYFVRDYLGNPKECFSTVIDTIKGKTVILPTEEALKGYAVCKEDYINSAKEGVFLQNIVNEVDIPSGKIVKSNETDFEFEFNCNRHYIYFIEIKGVLLAIIDGKIKCCFDKPLLPDNCFSMTLTPKSNVGVHTKHWSIYFNLDEEGITLSTNEFIKPECRKFLLRYKNFRLKGYLHELSHDISSDWMPSSIFLPNIKDLLIKGYVFNDLTKGDIRGVIVKWCEYLERFKSGADFNGFEFCKALTEIKAVIPDITTKSEDALFTKYAFIRKEK